MLIVRFFLWYILFWREYHVFSAPSKIYFQSVVPSYSQLYFLKTGPNSSTIFHSSRQTLRKRAQSLAYFDLVRKVEITVHKRLCWKTESQICLENCSLLGSCSGRWFKNLNFLCQPFGHFSYWPAKSWYRTPFVNPENSCGEIQQGSSALKLRCFFVLIEQRKSLIVVRLRSGLKMGFYFAKFPCQVSVICHLIAAIASCPFRWIEMPFGFKIFFWAASLCSNKFPVGFGFLFAAVDWLFNFGDFSGPKVGYLTVMRLLFVAGWR